MNYIKLFENYQKNNNIVYHGSYIEHKFNNKGELFNGTFFSTNKHEASSYGKFLYEVELEDNLNIFDTFNDNDLKLLFDTFGELYDTYYNEKDEEYLKTKPSDMKYEDNWNPIENTPDVIDWLDVYYDGVWVYEGGVKNLLLFMPLDDKIKKIKQI